MIKYSLGGAAVALSIAAAAPALAGPVVTFTTTGNTATTGTAGNSKTYTSNTNNVHVRASAYSLVDGQLQTAFLGQYGAGLGVTSSIDGTGSNNQHTTDNYGATNPNQSGLDFIMLQFDAPVRLLSGILTPFALNGSIDNDSTTAHANTAQLWSNALDFTDASFVSQLNGSLATKAGNGTTGAISLNDVNAFGNVWLLGASFFNTDGVDAFKLNTVKVEVNSAVPEPATWGLMLAGFGLVGVAARRRPNRLVQAI